MRPAELNVAHERKSRKVTKVIVEMALTLGMESQRRHYLNSHRHNALLNPVVTGDGCVQRPGSCGSLNIVLARRINRVGSTYSPLDGTF